MDIKFEPFNIIKVEPKTSFKTITALQYKFKDKGETLYIAIRSFVLYYTYINALKEEGIDEDLIPTENEFIESDTWKDTGNEVIHNKLYELYIDRKDNDAILKGG